MKTYTYMAKTSSGVTFGAIKGEDENQAIQNAKALIFALSGEEANIVLEK